jgi:hypothetical protein
MNVTQHDSHIHIALSRRNLEHLLTMLDRKVGSPTLKRRDGELALFVTAEENEEHYQGREPGPGAA